MQGDFDFAELTWEEYMDGFYRLSKAFGATLATVEPENGEYRCYIAERLGGVRHLADGRFKTSGEAKAYTLGALRKIGGSSNGRTADSDSADLGSTPSPPTKPGYNDLKWSGRAGDVRLLMDAGGVRATVINKGGVWSVKYCLDIGSFGSAAEAEAAAYETAAAYIEAGHAEKEGA